MNNECLRMLFRRLVPVVLFIPVAAFAATYSDYKSFNTQLTRAFAVPETTYTYKTVKTTSTTYTSSPNSSRSASGGLRNFSAPQDNGNSWAMPLRQKNTAVADPVHDHMLDLVIKARRAGGRPDVTKATEVELATFYINRGIRVREAYEAAYDDYREGTRILKAQQGQQQAAVAAYQAKEAAAGAAYARKIQQAKAVALKKGDRESAAQWFALVRPSALMWNGSYVKIDPAANREAVLHAANKGVPEAIFHAWGLYRRDDPEGFVWRDRSAALGSLDAMEALLMPPAMGEATNFRALVERLEQAYPAMPTRPFGNDPEYSAGAAPAYCAHVLARLHAQGDATLPADPVRALEWASKVPVVPGAKWQQFSHVVRANTLSSIMSAVAVSPETVTPLREAWEQLARGYEQAGVKSGAGFLKTQIMLAEGFSGFDAAAAQSQKSDRAAEPLRRIKALSATDREARVWLLRQANRTGDWALGESVSVGDYDGEGAYQQGLFWLNRTDGKADLGVAIVCLRRAEKAGVLDADGYLLLSACETKRQYYSEAQQALERAPDRLGPYELARVLLPLAQMRYKRSVTTADGDRTIATIRELLPAPKTEREHAFVRELEYQSIVAPFLKQYAILNGVDLEIEGDESRVGETVFYSDDRPPLDRTPAQIEDELRRLAGERAKSAAARRALFEATLPKLHALVLVDQPEARRLWSWVVLSGQVTVSAEEILLARAYLADAAKTGDLASMNVLGESLYREAGKLRESGKASEADVAAGYAEAADWLDAAYRNGSREVRWPLVTIYRDGLGRPKAREKVVALLESLAADSDKAAAAQLGALRAGG
jgi:hypothetical protein